MRLLPRPFPSRSLFKLAVPSLALAGALSLALAGGAFAQSPSNTRYGHDGDSSRSGQTWQSGQNGDNDHNSRNWQSGQGDNDGHNWQAGQSGDRDDSRNGDRDRDGDQSQAWNSNWGWSQPASYQPAYYPVIPSYSYPAYVQTYSWQSYGPGWDSALPFYQVQQTCQQYDQAILTDPNAYNPYVQQTCSALQAGYGVSYPYSYSPYQAVPVYP